MIDRPEPPGHRNAYAKNMKTITTNLTLALLLISALSASAPRANAQGGIPLWTNYYNEWDGDVAPTAVATDSSGNVFITGVLHTAAGRGSNSCTTVAYSSAGVPLWTNHIVEEAGGANAVVVNNGKVFITGVSWNGTDTDYRT